MPSWSTTFKFNHPSLPPWKHLLYFKYCDQWLIDQRVLGCPEGYLIPGVKDLHLYVHFCVLNCRCMTLLVFLHKSDPSFDWSAAIYPQGGCCWVFKRQMALWEVLTVNSKILKDSHKKEELSSQHHKDSSYQLLLLCPGNRRHDALQCDNEEEKPMRVLKAIEE